KRRRNSRRSGEPLPPLTIPACSSSSCGKCQSSPTARCPASGRCSLLAGERRWPVWAGARKRSRRSDRPPASPPASSAQTARSPPPPASLASLGAFLPTLLWPVDPCHLYDLACHLALASTLPGENGRPGAADQGVALLRCCVASGFDNLHLFRTDPALEPLR